MWTQAIQEAYSLLFVDSVWTAVLLATVAVSIPLVARGAEWLAGRALVGFSFELVTALMRLWLGTPRLRRRIATTLVAQGPDFLNQARQIDTCIGWVERRLANLRRGRQPIALALFDERVLGREIDRVERRNVRLLESDRSILEALSGDEALTERGVLNLSVNPYVGRAVKAAEELHVLLAVLMAGGNAGELAKYHVGKAIRESSQMRLRLREAATQVPQPKREEVDRVIAELERQLAADA